MANKTKADEASELKMEAFLLNAFPAAIKLNITTARNTGGDAPVSNEKNHKQNSIRMMQIIFDLF